MEGSPPRPPHRREGGANEGPDEGPTSANNTSVRVDPPQLFERKGKEVGWGAARTPEREVIRNSHNWFAKNRHRLRQPLPKSEAGVAPNNPTSFRHLRPTSAQVPWTAGQPFRSFRQNHLSGVIELSVVSGFDHSPPIGLRSISAGLGSATTCFREFHASGGNPRKCSTLFALPEGLPARLRQQVSIRGPSGVWSAGSGRKCGAGVVRELAPKPALRAWSSTAIGASGADSREDVNFKGPDLARDRTTGFLARTRGRWRDFLSNSER